MTDEEMAEEYIKANNLEWELECHRTSPIGEVKQAFQKGAEFGYNKANEWHFVKDEKDSPTDKKEYLLLLGSGIRTFGFYNGRFWESWKGDFSWQEVKAYFFVPVPELKESE